MSFINRKAMGCFAMFLGLGSVGNVNADSYNPNQNCNNPNQNYNTTQGWNQNRNQQGYRAIPDYNQSGDDSYQNTNYNQNPSWNQNQGYRASPDYNQNPNYNQNSNWNQNQGYRASSDYDQNTNYNQNPNSNQNQGYRAAPEYNQDQNQNQRSQGSNMNRGQLDQDLAKKIQDKINSGWFSKTYGNVVAKVMNGNVTLHGQVKTWDDKTKLEDDIRNMKDVTSLNSQVTVQEQNSMERPKAKFAQDRSMNPTDEQLNKKIRDNISSGWLWTSYKDIGLNSSNGVVTLEGTVDNLSDQQKLINEIQKIDGVRSVKSNLRIQNR